MPELRQRKLRDDTASPPPSISRTRSLKQPRRFRKIFIFLIVLALCGTYLMGIFAGQNGVLDGIAKSLGYESDYHYAVIIDAGSSGTRVLAYKFRVPFTVFGITSLDLLDEYWEQTKPGLSAFADDPDKGAETIVKLISNAESMIPKEKRSRTPLVVRATAGLRLLPEEKANALIQSVRNAVSKLGYDVASNSVEIMDGADEGIFIWYTVNLLHNLIDGETMAALDLGGGSTQITYQLNAQLAGSVPSADTYTVPTGAYNISVYTHSYLNLGLYAARYALLRLETGSQNETHFTSKCVDPIIQNEPWTYANKQLYVSGAPRPANMKRSAAFTDCQAEVRRVLRGVGEGAAPPRGAVAAMSFYFDVAADAGIIDVMKGGSVTVSQYRSFAYKACSASNIEQPWACLDLTYVAALLHDGLKIKEDEKISLYKKINGHEVSWALGLAYTTLMNRIAV